jgi:hypothetical protein
LKKLQHHDDVYLFTKKEKEWVMHIFFKNVSAGDVRQYFFVGEVPACWHLINKEIYLGEKLP